VQLSPAGRCRRPDFRTSDMTAHPSRAPRRAARPAPPTLTPVFFLFGLNTKQQHLGPGATRTCPRCQNTTQWGRMSEFTQFTVFFLPVARFRRRQFEACGVCGNAVDV